MPLSSELVSQFAKLASNKPKEEKESTTYGTAVIQNGNKYVKLDGSELFTPASFTTNIADGERVTVLIKNHMAVVTGNITSPSARTSEVEEVGDEVEEVGNKVKALNAAKANIEDLEATNASIANLDATKANIEDLNATYANIDFANVGVADIKEFYAKAGVIQDIIIEDQKITGRLVGVRITGDLIEGETVKANNLIILGDDGLYYKLNVNALGEAEASKDDKYKYGLDGSVIVAESITADKVSVSDLVAFGATIGGFHISDSSIYSGVKTAVDSPESGTYFDSEGQISFGDADNFIRYYKNTDGEYKLDISTAKIIQNSGSIDLLIKKVDSVRGECSADTDEKLKDYVAASDYNSDKENTSHAMEDMTKTINSKANADDLSGYTPIADHNKILKYMKFDENGITIGSGISNDQGQGQGQNKNLTLNLDNDAIKFKNGEEVIGSWDGTNFYTGDIVIKLNQRAQFGNFAFVPRSDGSIMFLKVKD